jgi:hypothetical protein
VGCGGGGGEGGTRRGRSKEAAAAAEGEKREADGHEETGGRIIRGDAYEDVQKPHPTAVKAHAALVEDDCKSTSHHK